MMIEQFSNADEELKGNREYKDLIISLYEVRDEIRGDKMKQVVLIEELVQMTKNAIQDFIGDEIYKDGSEYSNLENMENLLSMHQGIMFKEMIRIIKYEDAKLDAIKLSRE